VRLAGCASALIGRGLRFGRRLFGWCIDWNRRVGRLIRATRRLRREHRLDRIVVLFARHP
jgi:hypothetical protein